MGLSADACRLLHKIQSADAPSKLDDIFKQGVLDIPESIRLAHETVDDYNRFNENFHSMEDKMARVAILQTSRHATANTQSKPANDANTNPSTPTANMATQHCPHGRARAWPAKCALVCRPRSARSRSRRRPSIGRCSASASSTRESTRQGTYPRYRRRQSAAARQGSSRVRQDIDEASRQRHAIAERFEQVEGRLPDSEQTWDANAPCSPKRSTHTRNG